MISNGRILGMLAEMARLITIDEGTSQAFKVRAYENAIHGIEGYSGNVAELDAKAMAGIKGVGPSIAARIVEFIETGSVKRLDELRSSYPAEFVELLKIPGLGPKTLKMLRSELGIGNLDDLKAALEREALRALPGMGKTSEEKIARAIDRLGLHGKDRRTPIAEAWPVATSLATELAAIDGVTAAVPAGSLRRLAETIGDIDIVVAAGDAQPVMDAVAGHSLAQSVVGSGEKKTSVITRSGMQIDVRVVSPSQLGAALLYFTGSKAHNISLRQRAIDRGWLLNEYGLFEGDTVIAAETEEVIYKSLDLPLLPPPIRENSGEIQAAAKGTLPALVHFDQIKGDLHFHSDRSGDGRSTLEEMVAAVAARGYHYLAITEHGEDLAINGSSREQMLAHRDRIRSVGEQYPDMTLLYGCELNIGPTGGLDYDLDFRLLFDWCVASVHSSFDLPAQQQTARLLRAMSDPAVNVIGHLTGRYIGRRPGIELDLDSVLEGLAVSGVALEVNGALDRLDASAETIRRAVAAGVKLVISTDSHHTSDLRRMEFGVANAQRGWAASADVLNTLDSPAFLDFARSRR
ncbi:MAG TPA: DNA polymerase/3'-5' exonuclease PolX [Acidimicrobiia bacterium]|nr:DNA polymerase/3'-5' exonuclease PolX [Acidimicrobiia bacterium]